MEKLLATNTDSPQISSPQEAVPETPKPRVFTPPLDPAETLRRHEAKMAERMAAIKAAPTKADRKAQQLAAAAKARAASALKRQQREAIRKKVELGLPITEEENELLNFRTNVKHTDPARQREQTLAAASRLVVKTGDVKTLRGLVEKVAEKHKYNPLEQLIMMTLPDAEGRYSLPADERAAIHKSLLPYLTPQLKVAPLKEPEPEAAGTKVTIKQFVFPEETKSGKIYDAPRVRVSTTQSEAAESQE